MGFFSFFGKKKKVVESIKEIEILPYEKLFDWIEKKMDFHKKSEGEFIAPIKERIEQLVSELKEEIIMLGEIDLSDRKVNERVRSIIYNNLKNYTGHMEKMISKLEGINKRENFVEDVNAIFKEFEKKSLVNYQKAAFLVEKNLKPIKDSIRNFLKDLENILKENKQDFKEFEVIQSLKEDVKELKFFEKDKSKLLKNLEDEDKELDKLQSSIEANKKEIERIEQSDDFLKEENRKNDIELKKKKFDKNICDLHSSINFKGLAHFYHKFEKEMKLVKEYDSNLKHALKTFKSEKLIHLLKESKLDNSKIIDLIRIIESSEKEISEASFDDFGIGNIKKDINIIQSEIKEKKLEKLVKGKKLKATEDGLKHIIDRIVLELKKIDIQLE
jgi:hypothetical protein